MLCVSAEIRFRKTAISGYLASEISTEARVVSQSIRNEAPFPTLSRAIVKFSTAAGSDETFISVRVRSCASPG